MVSNAFLIREPREMITSLVRVMPEPDVMDTGLPQQRELFERLRAESGDTPPGRRHKGRARRPEGNAGKTLRRARGAVPGKHAHMGGRAQGDGRRMGEALVRRGGGVDRLPAVSSEARRSSRPAARRARGVRRSLPRSLPLSNRA